MLVALRLIQHFLVVALMRRVFFFTAYTYAQFLQILTYRHTHTTYAKFKVLVHEHTLGKYLRNNARHFSVQTFLKSSYPSSRKGLPSFVKLHTVLTYRDKLCQPTIGNNVAIYACAVDCSAGKNTYNAICINYAD